MYYWSFSKRLNLTCDTLDTADVWWLVKALLQWVTLDTGWWHHTNLGLCINWSGTFQQEANHGNLSKVTSRVKWSVPSLTNKPICLNRRTRSFRSISLFVCLFLCLFLCQQDYTRKRLDRFTWNFQGRCGVTMGRPDSILGQFGETERCRDVHHGGGVCCAFAPQLVKFVTCKL